MVFSESYLFSVGRRKGKRGEKIIKMHHCVALGWQLVHNPMKNQLGNLRGYVKTDLEQILPELQEFLRSRNLSPEKRIPYHALWASRFIRFANSRPNSARETLVLEFLDQAVKLYIHR